MSLPLLEKALYEPTPIPTPHHSTAVGCGGGGERATTATRSQRRYCSLPSTFHLHHHDLTFASSPASTSPPLSSPAAPTRLRSSSSSHWPASSSNSIAALALILASTSLDLAQQPSRWLYAHLAAANAVALADGRPYDVSSASASAQQPPTIRRRSKGPIYPLALLVLPPAPTRSSTPPSTTYAGLSDCGSLDAAAEELATRGGPGSTFPPSASSARSKTIAGRARRHAALAGSNAMRRLHLHHLDDLDKELKSGHGHHQHYDVEAYSQVRIQPGFLDSNMTR